MSSENDAQGRGARLERLRRLGLQRGAGHLIRPHASAARSQAVIPGAPGAAVLPGEAWLTDYGPAWVATTRYPLDRHPDLAAWASLSPDVLSSIGRDTHLLGLEPGQAAFLDTETTGLSQDAGTYTFLIGIGVYDLAGPEPAFVVHQYFMRNPAEERAQLQLVEEALVDRAGLVSFNGRGFDMPLVNNRFMLAAIRPPLLGAPHLDLLPPSRRMWRARWGSCSLGNLERNVLGLERTAEDVPGYLIPDIYRAHYRTGEVSELMVRVFYHNLQDIVSMPLLAVRLAALFGSGDDLPDFAGVHPLECLSLGRWYEALARPEAGIKAYRAALGGPLSEAEQALSLRALADLYKRLGRQAEAAALWEEWIGTIPGDDLTPYVELAKYHEWRTGDLAAARGWAGWAARLVEDWAPGPARERALDEIGRRLERLARKMVQGGPGIEG